MLKDDRMMSMLTFVVIMLAVGTMIQRGEVFERIFGGGSNQLVLQRDEVIVRANTLSGIDVLANDQGLRDGDAAKLIIVKQPDCGRVFVREMEAHYLPAERCVGSQIFEYAISGRGYVENGEVVVAVRLVEPTQDEVTANARRDNQAPEPMASDAAENVVAEAPSPLATQLAATASGNGTATPTPTVPRPQTPTIAAGLTDTASDGGLGAESAVVGVDLDGAGLAPSMTAPTDTLDDTPLSIPVPMTAQPGPEMLRQPTQAIEGDGTGEQASATIGLERVESTDLVPVGAGETAGLSIQRENGGLDTNVPREGPPEIISGGSEQTGRAGLGEPAEALASIRGLGDDANLAPVDTTPPVVLPDPNVSSGSGPQHNQTQNPDLPAGQVAALTSPVVDCVVPPALILEIMPAGLTKVIVESPCYANTVAELSYDRMRLGVAINAEGAGIVAAVGFQQASDAVLRFVDGRTIGFNIPFSDTERMARVALVWQTAVDLDLNAFEFGAQPLSGDHVRPGQPRSYGEVRRRGGGYLIEYQPVRGIGDSVSVYTYWRRRGGRTGIVKLKVEFASRNVRGRLDTCNHGVLATPEFTILRSISGKLERPRHRSLASVDCRPSVDEAARYIADAVDDMIVLQR